MSSSGQAAGRGRWRNAVIGPDGGSGRLGNVSIGPDGELGEVGECYHGELHEMLAGIRLNVLRGVEPRRLHHLCSVSFELVCQREVDITASGWCQRFTPEAAAFLERLLQRLTQVRLEAEAAPVALLKRFTAVIVEDSSAISLPAELAERWRGCGGSAGSSQAMLKFFVRWNVLTGDLRGPLLTAGRHADGKSPFNEEEVPAGGLYLADLGFFGLWRLQQLSQRRAGHKRYYLLGCRHA